jgi:hypothetical protein
MASGPAINLGIAIDDARKKQLARELQSANDKTTTASTPVAVKQRKVG